MKLGRFIQSQGYGIDSQCLYSFVYDNISIGVRYIPKEIPFLEGKKGILNTKTVYIQAAKLSSYNIFRLQTCHCYTGSL